MLKLYDLTVEYKTEPIGLDNLRPRFSWKLQTDLKDTYQSAYRIVVSGKKSTWDTGRVESAQSILIPYEGPALLPCSEYAMEITVWTNQGEEASASSCFETGLLSGTAFEGKAGWITHGLPAEEKASPVFTALFTVSKPVAKARLYATACGLYEAELNGKKIGDTYLAPGWTSYHKRLQYQTYTVDTICRGINSIRFVLGEGWYKSPLGFSPTPNHYGDTTALLAMLVLTYEDGTEEVIGTNENWQVSTGSIRFSEIYDGETQDTVIGEQPAGRAKLFDGTYESLVAQENEPVRCLLKLPVQKDFIAPDGKRVLDFGQNLTGWAEVKVQGHPGQRIVLRHAESLDENGNFYTENLSFAKAADTYILNGEKQILRPHFTFHGFRYICLEGLEENQQIELTACHLSSDLKEVGSFRILSGASGIITWTFPQTAPSAANAWAGQVTLQLSRRRLFSIRTSCSLCANGFGTWRLIRIRKPVWRRSCRIFSRTAREVQNKTALLTGETRQRSFRGLCMRLMGTGRFWKSSIPA